MKQYYIYILSSKSKTLYIWVTNNLVKRIYEHRYKLARWFTSLYNINRLIHYEIFNDINEAIKREKQLKKWKRSYKIDLINNFNPAWEDLYHKIV